MTNYVQFAEQIKQCISMRQAVALYCPEWKPINNRMPCPIHGGNNYNLGYNGSVFHCFVCDTSGDVIDFVKHIFNLRFGDAIRKLNDDFNLGLEVNQRVSQRQLADSEKRRSERVRDIELRRAIQNTYDDWCWSVWSEWIRQDKRVMRYTPEPGWQEPKKEYFEALSRRNYLNYIIDYVL